MLLQFALLSFFARLLMIPIEELKPVGRDLRWTTDAAFDDTY